MYNYGNSNVEIDNSLFAGNQANNGGAVMDRVGVHSKMNNVRFTRNVASDNGGAINLDYGSRLQATNIRADHNTAKNDGGVLYSASRASQLEETVVSIKGARFHGNHAARNGQALAINDMSKAFLSGNLRGQADPQRGAWASPNSLVAAAPAPAGTFERTSKASTKV